MNKRIYFILFPLLAILFSIGWENNAVYFEKPAQELSLASSATGSCHHSYTGVKKEHNGHAKNAIRIKALHDIFAINISSTTDVVIHPLFSPRVIYGGYRLNELQVHFYTSRLRGPPVA